MLKQLRGFSISKAFQNFPIAVIAAIVVSSATTYIVAQEPYSHETFNTFFKIGISAFFVFLLSINAEVFATHNLKNRWLWNILSAVAGPFIYFLLPENIEANTPLNFRLPYQLFGSAIILHLLISYIPFRSSDSQEDFWEYNKELFIRFVESAFYSIFLFASLSIAIFAVDKLFVLAIDLDTYVYLLIFLVGIFHPIYFLSRFPDFNYDGQIVKPTRAFMVFSQYILIPVVAIYLLILYAYGGKILTQWSLPKGWVGQLSLWFSVIGIFTYLLNRFNHLFSDLRLTRYFQHYFFPILLVPILLIFIAIKRRIGDYGFTEERYIVLFVGIWLLALWLYFIFSKNKNIKYLPASLAFLIGISLFSGPINMFKSSINSQKNRLFSHLAKAGKFESGRIVNTETTYTEIDRKALTGIINALERRSDMRFFNQYLEDEISFSDENGDGSRIADTNGDLVMKTLGIKPLYSLQVDPQGYFSIYTTRSAHIDIAGYDQLLYFTNNNTGTLANLSPRVEIDMKNIAFNIQTNDILHVESFAKLVTDLTKSEGEQQQKILSQAFEFTAMDHQFKVYFEGLSGKMEDDGIKLEHAGGTILIGPVD